MALQWMIYILDYRKKHLWMYKTDLYLSYADMKWYDMTWCDLIWFDSYWRTNSRISELHLGSISTASTGSKCRMAVALGLKQNYCQTDTTCYGVQNPMTETFAGKYSAYSLWIRIRSEQHFKRFDRKKSFNSCSTVFQGLGKNLLKLVFF